MAREAQDETLKSQKQQRRRLSLVRPRKSKLSLARAVQKQITISKKHQRRLSLVRAAKMEILEETPIGQSSKKGDIGGDSHWSEHAIKSTQGCSHWPEHASTKGCSPLVREAQKETLEETPIGQSMQAQKDAPIGQRSTKVDIGGDSHWSEQHKRMLPLVRKAQKGGSYGQAYCLTLCCFV